MPDCYAGVDADAPVHMKTSENISSRMHIAVKLGFYVHIVGFAAAVWRLVTMKITDIKIKQKSSIAGLCFFVVFLVMWLVWFVSMHWVRFSHAGKVCSGDLYMIEGADKYFSDMGYALHQGVVIKALIIVEWMLLIQPLLLEAGLEICFRLYLKQRHSSK